VRANGGLQNRNGHDLGSAGGILFCAAAAAANSTALPGGAGICFAFALAENGHELSAGLQSGTSPVKPAVVLPASLPSSIVIRAWGRADRFPTRYVIAEQSTCGQAHPGKFLIFAKVADLFSPIRGHDPCVFFGH